MVEASPCCVLKLPKQNPEAVRGGASSDVPIAQVRRIRRAARRKILDIDLRKWPSCDACVPRQGQRGRIELLLEHDSLAVGTREFGAQHKATAQQEARCDESDDGTLVAGKCQCEAEYEQRKPAEPDHKCPSGGFAMPLHGGGDNPREARTPDPAALCSDPRHET